ncbi:Putrescine-binding periplasmic protein [Mycoavidus cysteinexigens]|uniref:Putrescine-binding periplasmic protein n=1 Tax=Mycoavidus cysteinexigens TaxID=1553431 RepID=A0A2Z6EUQ4_9BURK|nr:extracellular solute-binding protein [Mycoavidus cysteinexigens]BBE09148.1 Putrescine-binding periplasmic protein [Mycoavidus cysteinexigens]GAM52111.1 ABC transporter, periplasmic spermidine putrescine-binding protein PotD [bacterium endosymbiont of Mortierella elongata FMR23-6]GLR01905.1 putrescine-binding periplasmic protein [Mycoavidus cysteinexigens]
MKKLKFSVAGTLLYLCNIANAQGALHFASAENYYPPELLQKFEQETGIKTTFDTYDSDTTLSTKLKAGGAIYDVVIINQAHVPILVKSHLLRKLEAEKLPNTKNIKPEYLSPLFDPKREYTMPYTVILTSFAYDSARIPGGKLEDSWGAYFKPDKALWGKIGNLNEPDDLYVAASWYLGLDECSENAKDAKKVLKLLSHQKPYVMTYNNEGTIPRLVNREVIMQQIWNGAAVRVRPQLPTIVFAYPKEGVSLSWDNFVVPRRAKNVDEAHQFINWMLQPENIAQVSNKYKYSNAIIGSEKFTDPRLVNDPAFNTPDELRNRLRPYKLCSPKALALRSKVWMKLKINN